MASKSCKEFLSVKSGTVFKLFRHHMSASSYFSTVSFFTSFKMCWHHVKAVVDERNGLTSAHGERVAKWLRHLTRKPKVRTAIGSNPVLDSLVAVRYSSPGGPEPCERNLVAATGSCIGLMVKHPWPLLEISLSDFCRLATLNIYTYLPTI